MNKRKPDDEFARINLSFLDADGKEVVVFCPESRKAKATQNPVRKTLATGPTALVPAGVGGAVAGGGEAPARSDGAPAVVTPTGGDEVSVSATALKEQHFTIYYGDMGYSFDSIVGPYLVGAREIVVEDPYVRLTHQVQNFVRLCETVVKLPSVKKVRLVTSRDESTNAAEVQERLEQLKQSLLEADVVLEVELNPNLHDREIRIDNGWVVKIGRGLDFYQKPDNWFAIGANDLSLRKCLETKVDIFRA